MGRERAEVSGPDALFVERQWLASVWWVSGLVLVCAVLGWHTLFNPPEDAPSWLQWLFWGLTGVALPLLVLTSRLETTVTRTALTLHFRPLQRRQLPAADIVHGEVRTFRPVKEYGGWGIRGWGDDRAYTVRGNRGVQLTLTDGQRVLVGSQRPEELAAALYRMSSRPLR